MSRFESNEQHNHGSDRPHDPDADLHGPFLGFNSGGPHITAQAGEADSDDSYGYYAPVPFDREARTAPDYRWYKPERTFEGQLVTDAEREARSKTLEQHVADEPIVGFGGSSKEDVARAITRTVMSHIRKDEGGVVLVADFSAEPGITRDLLAAARAARINMTDTRLLDPKGMLASMSTDTVARIIGIAVGTSGAGQEDFDTAVQASEILKGVEAHLREKLSEEAPPGVTVQPTWQNIRDGVRGLRKLKQNQIPTLERDHVEDLLNNGPFGETETNATDRPLLARLGRFLDAFVPEDDPEAGEQPAADAAQPAEQAPPQTGWATIMSARVSGTDLKLEADRTILSRMLLPSIEDGTPDGPITMIVLGSVNRSKLPGLEELLEHAENRGIKVVVSEDRLNSDNSGSMIGRGAMGITRVTDGKQAAAAQELGGTHINKDEVSSTGYTYNETDGGSSNDGTSLNYEKGSPDAKSGGRSWGGGPSWSASWSEARTVTHRKDAARLPAAALQESLQPGEMVIMRADRTILGVFNTHTGKWVREFPPRDERPATDDLRARYEAGVREQRQRLAPDTADRVPGGQQRSAIGSSAVKGAGGQGELAELRKVDVGTPRQEEDKVRDLFLQQTGKSMYAPGAGIRHKTAFIKFAHDLYLDRKERGETDLSWEDWQDVHLDNDYTGHRKRPGYIPYHIRKKLRDNGFYYGKA